MTFHSREAFMHFLSTDPEDATDGYDQRPVTNGSYSSMLRH
jgi:hypothetical protein